MTTPYFSKPADLAPVTKARSVDINNLTALIAQAFANIPNYSQTWTGTHDFTGGVMRVAPPVGVTDAATKAYVDSVAFKSVSLPGQAGSAGKFLQTDGTTPTWQLVLPAQAGNAGKALFTDGVNSLWKPAGVIPRSERTANVQLVAADNASIIDITANSFIQTFAAAATLGAGWYCYIQNSGTGNITIPLSDGMANWIMYPGETRLFVCDGANINSVVLCAFTWVPSATANFICPPGYNSFDVEGWGAGGGGGAGYAGGNGFGGAGGGGGAYFRRRVLATEIGGAGASVTCAIGAGGNGGAAVTGTAVTGNSGITGGTTSFGSIINAPGGLGGPGGASTSAGVSAVGVAGVITQPYGGGSPGGQAVGANQSQPAATIMSGSAGGNGGMYNGTNMYLGAPGGARISGSGGAASNGVTTAGNGGPFQGGGGGASLNTNTPLALKGGDAGTASGGGGGGTQVSSIYPSGAGGKGGNGYMVIRGE